MIRWKSTVIPGFLKHRHRLNIGQESGSESERDADRHRKQIQLSKESQWKDDSRRRRKNQCASIVNLIQMKWMKVIYTIENMMNQEFQHCSESQLIEVMNVKMHSIQFALKVPMQISPIRPLIA
jgi:hypothetical protein